MSEDKLYTQEDIDALDSAYSKVELVKNADRFGVEVKNSWSKPEIINAYLEDGVYADVVKTVLGGDDAEEAPAPVEHEETPVEEDDDQELVLVRMVRANNTYEIRGHRFTLEHPYALVKESDADYLIEQDGGFRMASPKEAAEYYS